MLGIGQNKKINKLLNADDQAIENLKKEDNGFFAEIFKITSLSDIVKILAVGFGCMGLSHFLSDVIVPHLSINFPELQNYSLTSGFFWIVVLAATLGLSAVFYSCKVIGDVGASKFGSLMLYVLIATIGMNMNILSVFGKSWIVFAWIYMDKFSCDIINYSS